MPKREYSDWTPICDVIVGKGKCHGGDSCLWTFGDKSDGWSYDWYIEVNPRDGIAYTFSIVP